MNQDKKSTQSALWKERSREHFRNWSENYDRDIINILLFKPSYQRVLACLRQWRRRGQNQLSLLDVGCGTGTLLLHCLHLAPNITKVTGLDMSEDMINIARQKLSPYMTDHNIDLHNGDAEHLPFADNRFDVVTCCNSFHHYPDKLTALREMRRVLRPGGHIIVIDGSPDNLFGYMIFEVGVAYVEKHVHHCDSGEFKELLTRAGFSDIHQNNFGICPPALLNVANANK